MEMYFALEGTFIIASAYSIAELRHKVNKYAERWKCKVTFKYDQYGIRFFLYYPTNRRSVVHTQKLYIEMKVPYV